MFGSRLTLTFARDYTRHVHATWFPGNVYTRGTQSTTDFCGTKQGAKNNETRKPGAAMIQPIKDSTFLPRVWRLRLSADHRNFTFPQAYSGIR